MDKEILFIKLLDEYFDQFGDVTDIIGVRSRQGIDAAIELLQNRDGKEIIFQYFNRELYEDQEPEIIYE